MAFSSFRAPAVGEIREGRERISPVVLFCAMVAGTLTLAGVAQVNQPSSLPPKPYVRRDGNRPPDANDQMLMQQAKTRKMNFDAANTERLRQIAQAAEMLETLAISLKVQIDKDQSSKVSEDELRKAENIAKLAHIVQERMKLTVAPN